MTSDDESRVSRVLSRDGTEIAYWTTGQGPPLVVVHGTPADHTRWAPLLPYLEPHFTVHAVDRRGRGGSGDSPDYALEREFEDVVAVVDAVAHESGALVNLYGHSHGGIVAFGAAALTSNIRRLVLYEGWHVSTPDVYALPEGLDLRMDTLLEAGDRDAVVELLFRGLEDMSDEDMAAFKAAPSWPGRVAAAQRSPARSAESSRPVSIQTWPAGSPCRSCWSRETRAPMPARPTWSGWPRRCPTPAPRSRGPRARRRCSVMDARRLALPAACADVVVAAFMLFHLPDPRAALAEAHRVLRPGGWCGVSVWGRRRQAAVVDAATALLDREGVPAEEPDPSRSDALLNSPRKLGAVLRAARFANVRAWVEPLDHRWEAGPGGRLHH